MQEAINNKSVEVNLVTTNFNYDRDGQAFCVGEYYGSKEDENGITHTAQLFNYEHAEKWELAGGSNPGLSAIHEILESYEGGKLFPNQGIGYDKRNFLICHAKVRNLEEPAQYQPQRFDEVERIDEKTYKHKRTYIIGDRPGKRVGALISKNPD